MVPEVFWVIQYGALVWDRRQLGFVPTQSLRNVVPSEYMQRVWFLTEEEVLAQAEELRVLEVIVEVARYHLSTAEEKESHRGQD